MSLPLSIDISYRKTLALGHFWSKFNRKLHALSSTKRYTSFYLKYLKHIVTDHVQQVYYTKVKTKLLQIQSCTCFWICFQQYFTRLAKYMYKYSTIKVLSLCICLIENVQSVPYVVYTYNQIKQQTCLCDHTNGRMLSHMGAFIYYQCSKIILLHLFAKLFH